MSIDRSWLVAGFAAGVVAAAAGSAHPAGGGPPLDGDSPVGGAAPSSAEELVEVRLTADTTRIGPGQRAHLAVVFDLQPHWHIYWANAGNSGAATDLRVVAPEGFNVGETRFPRPSSFQEPEGTTYGYENRAVLFVPITAPQELEDGEATFHVEYFFLVCRDRCLLGGGRVTLTLPTSATATDASAAAAPDRALLDEHERRLPRPLSELKGAEARLQDGRLVLTGPAAGVETVQFFPAASPGVACGEARIAVADGRFRIEVSYEAKAQNAMGRPTIIGGVVGLGGTPAEPCYDFKLPVAAR